MPMKPGKSANGNGNPKMGYAMAGSIKPAGGGGGKGTPKTRVGMMKSGKSGK